PYSPTVPGTGCASLKGNPPDVITCWPGWAEQGLCPARNRGLEKLVANQMRVALKNTSVDVCKLKEYILLAGLEEEDSKENDRNDDKMIAHPPLAGGPAVEDPSQSSSSQRPQLPDQVPAAPASEIKPLPAKKPVIVSHPGVPVQPVVLPFRSSPKPVRSGVVSIRDLKPQGFSKSSKCGLVFVSPTGAEALIPMEAQRCEALSRVLKSKGVIGSKEAEILIKEASFSEKALMAADQKCNAGLGRYRDYMLHLAAAIAKSNPDAGTVSNVLALLEDAVDRTKDSIRACVDRSFKAPRK
ncbi:MAG: hypothetical protein EBX52_08685, partial [Proteobacteria bacterium]|nr:hypothetical protein [Pseudomonadota bacterium]